MSSPKEFKEDLRKVTGLSAEQQREILRDGLVQFQEKLPGIRVHVEVQNPPPAPGLKYETVNAKADQIPPAVTATAQPPPTAPGSGDGTKDIFIIEAGVAVEYTFQATPV